MSNIIWVILMGICHCNPKYDTCLESSGPCECSGCDSWIVGHHQDDQEGP